MQIDLDLLFTWGAVSKKYQKDEVIFYEEDLALFYYQIIQGTVKMFNTNEDGKEFTQGLFYKGNSFGEPPLLINEVYPCTAIAIEDCVVIKISKDKFLTIIHEYPAINQKILELLAFKAYRKAVTSRQIINQKPEFRINAFLDNYKKSCTTPTVKVQIPFTRQEIADFTGLRVETVIRTLTKMKKDKKVEITNHKLFY
ncbi:Crp/Fnr family transcriptional regulator [Flavobacterium sp. 316]|uniref:Crp/Fnr family transcriptional regulator n=1 Tax=Flavobacterium sediminilitoris TaxID=2024526 RepID=A0ABY4HLI1_9FLAO|nr:MULTISPECIES: Crp/Fnr family transcriptional regulator [Flavobacterium]KIX20359.1 Crp/Fnr family transcriptional regulator [Flavobacterium sp. 316]UOX33516.1 Crp/Fnr family transcriptional regulator [Flavobacterium sediminilitoris]